jgi:hypothetical protein
MRGLAKKKIAVSISLSTFRINRSGATDVLGSRLSFWPIPQQQDLSRSFHSLKASFVGSRLESPPER